MFVSCFIPDDDAIFHARKIAKRIGFFSCFTQFGACNEASYPPFLCPLHPKTPPLHPCSVARNPVFSYPKTPFGMSHFTIWGIPFYHLGYFKVCLCPHIGERFYPLFALISSHFRGKNGRQNACLSPQLCGNQTTRSLLQCPHAG